MFTITIDPGLRGCGLAIGDDELRHAQYVVGETNTAIKRAPVWAKMAASVRHSIIGRFSLPAELVIEYPQVYKPGHQVGPKSRTDPGDLIELAAVVGGIVSELSLPTTAWLPCEWKGQVPKEIMHERAKKRLSPNELAIAQQGLPRAGLAHNVWDAVSIFLHRKGRL